MTNGVVGMTESDHLFIVTRLERIVELARLSAIDTDEVIERLRNIANTLERSQ